MVKWCCICKIESGAIPNISFHNVPKDEEIKLQWVAVIGREVSKHSAVCSKHFDEKDFQYKTYSNSIRRYLLPGAVPVIHGHPNSEIIENLDNNESALCCETNYSKSDESSRNIESSKQCELNYNKNVQASYEKEESEQQYETYYFPCDACTADNTNCKSIQIDSNKFPSKRITEVKESVNHYTDNIMTDKRNITILKQSIAKRKRENDASASSTVKSIHIPGSTACLKRKDFTSDRSYQIFIHHINNTKKTQTMLNQKIRRLTQKLECLQSLFECMRTYHNKIVLKNKVV